MIKNGEFFMIKDMKQKGMNITQMANELGRDRKTIRRWLEEDAPRSYHRIKKQPSKVGSVQRLHSSADGGGMPERCRNSQ